jgi:hypothetical protein
MRHPHKRIMKKVTIISILAFSLLTGVVIILLYGFSSPGLVVAQTNSPEVERQREERDKTVSAEKLIRLRREAETVQNEISALMKKSFPTYAVKSSRTYGPEGQGNGRKGQISLRFSWTKKGTEVGLYLTFVFSPTEAEEFHLKKLNGVAMGEGFRAPELFGKDASLVKNVQFNKTMTCVALHFRKGRLMVSANIVNDFRPNSENEKELLKIMEAIYPVLIAKENFEEV